MSEVREDRNLGGLGYSGETAPLAPVKRRGLRGPGMTGAGLLYPASEESDKKDDFSSGHQDANSFLTPKTKERKRRIHPYNISRGTATWSGPYGKDGTIRLEDVPADVVAYPVYKKAYSGALTVMVEVDSPPEFKGQRFQVAKPIKGKGWYK